MYRKKYAHKKNKYVGMEAMIIFGLLYVTFFLWSFLFMTVPPTSPRLIRIQVGLGAESNNLNSFRDRKSHNRIARVQGSWFFSSRNYVNVGKP